MINDKNVIKLTSIDHIDPKGNIPSFIINLVHSKIMDKLEQMNELFKKII